MARFLTGVRVTKRPGTISGQHASIGGRCTRDSAGASPSRNHKRLSPSNIDCVQAGFQENPRITSIVSPPQCSMEWREVRIRSELDQTCLPSRCRKMVVGV
jgi:hypothetical protein